MAATNYSPIQLYYSTTASAAPAAGNLVSGELAINITDGKLYYKDNAGTVQLLSTSTTANGTANGVLYLNGSKVATSGSALTFDGTNLLQATGGAAAVFRVGSAISSGRASTINLGNNAGVARATIALDAGTELMTIGSEGNFPVMFQVNGSEAMRVTSTGLGIGTSSPGFAIDIAKSTAVIRIQSTTGTNSAYMTTTNSGGDFYMGRENSTGTTFGSGTGYTSVLWSAGAYPMAFFTNGNERMRLDTSGNLGLGVTPSVWLSTYRALQFGIGGGLAGRSDNGGIELSSNAYRNSAGSYIYLNTDNAASYRQYSGQHQWWNSASGTAGNAITFTQAMTLTAGGNLLVGSTSTPASGSANIVSAYASGGGVQVAHNNSGGGALFVALGGGGVATYTYTGAVGSESYTERARIDSSGNLLVGKTSSGAASTAGCEFGTYGAILTRSSGDALLVNRETDDGAAVTLRRSNVTVGTISVTTSVTSYNTSSDYRLKNITGPITNSGAYIDSLNPVEGTWKADGSVFVGLIAHEVQEASRTQVATGVKDGDEMQGMDYSNSEIIANLIAEVKSLRKRLADAGIA